MGFERLKLKESPVYYNGEVTYFSPAILTFSCKINARTFPFDWQVCKMRFSSWNYHNGELIILPLNGSDSLQKHFAYKGVWELKNVKVQLDAHCYNFGHSAKPEWKPLSELIYIVYLKRQPLHHVLDILVPCFLLSILNLMVNLLPPEAGEKITLGTTNLLALLLFQELVSVTLPPSSDNPPIISK